VKIPKGSIFDFGLQFMNSMESKVTVTGDLVFKKAGVEKRRIPIPTASIQPGQTVHKVYCLNAAPGVQAADYKVEIQGTAGGQDVFCGPYSFEIIEANGGFLDSFCPCYP